MAHGLAVDERLKGDVAAAALDPLDQAQAHGTVRRSRIGPHLEIARVLDRLKLERADLDLEGLGVRREAAGIGRLHRARAGRGRRAAPTRARFAAFQKALEIAGRDAPLCAELVAPQTTAPQPAGDAARLDLEAIGGLRRRQKPLVGHVMRLRDIGRITGRNTGRNTRASWRGRRFVGTAPPPLDARSRASGAPEPFERAPPWPADLRPAREPTFGSGAAPQLTTKTARRFRDHASSFEPTTSGCSLP